MPEHPQYDVSAGCTWSDRWYATVKELPAWRLVHTTVRYPTSEEAEAAAYAWLADLRRQQALELLRDAPAPLAGVYVHVREREG